MTPFLRDLLFPGLGQKPSGQMTWKETTHEGTTKEKYIDKGIVSGCF